MKLLDMETGGEFLLSLRHPNNNTAAIEAYPPNVKLCKEVLLPLGIDFKEGREPGDFPLRTKALIWSQTGTVITMLPSCGAC